MVRTEVGYAGGTSPSPTYHDLENHAEVLQVEFDPTQITFGELLEQFWVGHDPKRRTRSSQYRAILLCENESQLAIAKQSIAALEPRGNGTVETEVVLAQPFHPAEDYHQKWKLRQRHALFADLASSFESEEKLLRSFAATKLNAIVGRNMHRDDVSPLLDRLKLSSTGLEILTSLLPREKRAG